MGEGGLEDSNRNKTDSHPRLKATNLSHMTTSGFLLPDKKLMEPTVASVWTEKVNNQLRIKVIIICTCPTITQCFTEPTTTTTTTTTKIQH